MSDNNYFIQFSDEEVREFKSENKVLYLEKTMEAGAIEQLDYQEVRLFSGWKRVKLSR